MSELGADFGYLPQEGSGLKRNVSLFANSIKATVDEPHFLFTLCSRFQVFFKYLVILLFKPTEKEVIGFDVQFDIAKE